MMLSMDVLRWITVQALSGRTWAGDNVFDSPAMPSDLRIETERAPVVMVWVDDADLDLAEHNTLVVSPTVWLIIEVSVAEGTVVEDVEENQPKDTDADATTPEVHLIGTDQAMEANIGFLSRQVLQALLATDSQWAELWRKLVVKLNRAEIRRGGPGQEERTSAFRYASRVIRIEVELLSDPVLGETVPAGFWSEFLATAEADADLADIGRLVRAHIELKGGPLPSWRIAQKQLTITRRGVDSLGIAPVVIPDETEAPELEVVTFEDERPGGSFTIAEGEGEVP